LSTPRSEMRHSPALGLAPGGIFDAIRRGVQLKRGTPCSSGPTNKSPYTSAPATTAKTHAPALDLKDNCATDVATTVVFASTHDEDNVVLSEHDRQTDALDSHTAAAPVQVPAQTHVQPHALAQAPAVHDLAMPEHDVRLPSHSLARPLTHSHTVYRYISSTSTSPSTFFSKHPPCVV
jgi:hypothetical protein